jgi:hypothetical protein
MSQFNNNNNNNTNTNNNNTAFKIQDGKSNK